MGRAFRFVRRSMRGGVVSRDERDRPLACNASLSVSYIIYVHVGQRVTTSSEV
jgi:hypothetical protein